MNTSNHYLNALNSGGSGGSSASNQLVYPINNNQENSNLSTTSGGSHHSDKDNSIIILSQNNLNQNSDNMTPEKQRDNSTPIGTGRKRKRKHHHHQQQTVSDHQQELNNQSILNRGAVEGCNSTGALLNHQTAIISNQQSTSAGTTVASGNKSSVIQNQSSKKINDYFKHSPSRFNHHSAGSKSPTANSSSAHNNQTTNVTSSTVQQQQQPQNQYHFNPYNLPSSPSQQQHKNTSTTNAPVNQTATIINSPPNTPMLTSNVGADFLMGPPLGQLSAAAVAAAAAVVINNTTNNNLTTLNTSTSNNSSSVIQQQQAAAAAAAAAVAVNSISSNSTNNSFLYSNLISRAVQTDLTAKQIQELETKSASDLEEKETKIDDLQRSTEELKRQVNVHQKTIDKQKDQLVKSTEVTKKLLIDKSLMEKKASRQKCMQNRLRLGQFVTQRQGASFVESWNDGHAFTELIKKQEQITLEREEIERQRKLLAKRKPASVQVKKNNSSSTNVNNSNSQSTNLITSTSSSANSQSTVAAVVAAGTTAANNNLSNGTSGIGSSVASTSSVGFTDFAKPEVPGSSSNSISSSNLNSSTKELNWYEYYEMDEILKLRQQNLKKEDTDLGIELEKLERERNLHIRELKRIHNEDQSRFNNHSVLNERYLLLTLLGNFF